MKRKHLLFTLLLALVVPLAAFAQVERTVTVFNGNDINAHIPVDGGHGTLVPAKNQFIMDKADLSDIAGKQITKMTFHVVNSNITMKTGDHLPYSVLLAEVDVADFGNAGLLPDNLTNAHTVASGIQLELTGNTLVINFDRVYTYSGNKNLLVQFSCSSATNYFTPFYESYELRFYGVNATRAGVANMGMGIYRHYGFVPKTTFTYLDEATWANTNRPRNLQVSAHEDGYRLDVSWQAPVNYSGSYQVLCVARGTTPNWSNAEITTNTSTFFSQLDTNTAYDIYVRAKSAVMFSAPAKAIAMTKHIANLDNGNLILDFEGAFVPNGVTVTGAYSHRLDISRYWYIDFGYGSYHMQCPIGTVNLPSLAYQDANNGVIMEFDLNNATGLQVQFYKQGYTTTLGTFSATGWTHYTVRAEGLGAQNTAYFQLVSSNAFDIDNIVIRKASDVMPVTNLAASNIGENGATISWTDPNINTHSLALFYRPKGFTGGDWYRAINVTGTSYTLTELSPYTQYEVMVQAYNTSVLENSAILTFATACPATQTTYTQSFTNLSDLPQYWRVEKGNGVTYSVNNDRLTVSNTSYEYTTYGYTYTSYTTLDAYVIMPYFENLQSLQLSFKAGRTAGSYNELVVGVMSDPFNMSTFSILETRVLNGPSTTYNFNLANAAYTHGYIAIKLNHYENNLQNVWFDDFVVTQYAAPTELTVSNVTNTSATLGWNAGAATEWEVRYGTDANSYGTPVAVTEPTYTITDLTACTDYVAQVRAKYGENLYSEWVSFDSFKTYYSTPVVVDQTHPYSFGFQYLSMVGTVLASEGGWQMINMGLHANNWMIGTKPGTIDGFSGTNYSLFISKNGSDYQYIHGEQNVIGSWTGWATTVYAARVFNLAPGSYQFSYDWRAKGIHDSDYFRVVLVPANTELTAGTSVPSGFSYNSLPEGWIALDGGEALNPISFDRGFDTYTTPESARINILEGGDYMMVFVWHNMSSRTIAVQDPPIAFDNVAINCTSLVYPPAVAALHDQVTDTEAPLALYASEQGITPTSYEVQYEPAATVNTYEGAPIATFNVTETPQTVTLTGLTPLTIYSARVRSVYTANDHSVYSDWQGCPSLFTTLCTPPTNLVVVGQTSSWANVRWNPVEMTLPDGQYINYCVQLTTDPDDWGDEDCGWASDSWEKNLAPGTYHFRVRTAVYEGNLYMGGSDWSEPITFTIAPWTDPVTVFPMIQDFEAFSYRFANGLTLDGEYEHLDVLGYLVSGVPTPEGGENDYMLRFHSCSSKTAYLVLPPMRPSTSDALVSFWWYHDNSDNNANEGVTVEHSSDGSTWTTWGNKITRYAEETGWVKYQQVIPASGTDPVYIRLRFDGSNSNDWTRCCYLDDLSVNIFKSYQPYISYVDCDGSTADITLYDYAYENGYYSSAFQVQYREYRNPGEPEEDWVTYPLFDEEEPAFEHSLVVNGLQPTTLYEFRACARVSYGGFDFPWSNYCEPYRQWTSCGTYMITSEHSYTIDFEDEFYYNCWTGDIDETEWHVTTDDAHSGTKSFCVNGNTWKTLSTPTIDLTQLSTTTDNVVMRFWAKTSTTGCQVLVRYTYNGTTYNPRYMFIPKTDEWKQFEISLSKRMGNEITVEFKNGSNNTNFYLDDVEIVANPYSNTKIFDLGEDGYSANWTGSGNWFPDGTPDGNTNVRILEGSVTVQTNTEADAQSVFVGPNGRMTVKGTLNVDESLSSNIAKINTATNGEISGSIIIGSAGVLNAASLSVVDAYSFKVNDGGTANIGTLNPGEANSVIVKDGGLLNATTINGTTMGGNDKILIESGGQVKSGNDFYGIIKKNITGYGAANANNPTGWNLIATPALVTAVQTFVPQSGSEYLFDQMDIYRFTRGNELEWDNFKCPFEGGCDSPFGIIPQGQFSAELGQPLKGYLYALQEDATIQFAAGTVSNEPFSATNVDANVNLTYYTNPADASLNGWNLIGNPYTCNAYLKQDVNYIPFYKMNDTGDAIVGVPAGTPIKPCEAVFVCCTEPSSTVTITTTEPAGLGENPEDCMVLLPTHTLYEDQDAGTMMEIELVAGWNWFAPTIEMSLEALQSKLDSDAVIQLKEGNTSAIVAPGRMIKVYVDEEEGFSLMGRIVAASITIEDDINWIGYTGTTLEISAALASYDITPVEGDKIISQFEGFAIYTITEGVGSWKGTLSTLREGNGYIYFRPPTE